LKVLRQFQIPLHAGLAFDHERKVIAAYGHAPTDAVAGGLWRFDETGQPLSPRRPIDLNLAETLPRSYLAVTHRPRAPFDRLGAALPGGGARAVIGAGAAVMAVSVALSGRALGRGGVAGRVRRVFARLPLLRSLAARHDMAVETFTEEDAAAARYFGRPLRDRAWSAVPFLLAWCVEAFETWFLLRLVGVELGLGVAFCLEVPLGLLRSVAFFTPAGLGVQDLAYATALASLGVPDAPAAALGFVMLKRCKETLWIAVGYALLALGRSPPQARAAERAA
jgi:hypothetical protein